METPSHFTIIIDEQNQNLHLLRCIDAPLEGSLGCPLVPIDIGQTDDRRTMASRPNVLWLKVPVWLQVQLSERL